MVWLCTYTAPSIEMLWLWTHTAREWLLLITSRAFGITKSCSNELNYGAIFLPSANQRIGLKYVKYAFMLPSKITKYTPISTLWLVPGFARLRYIGSSQSTQHFQLYDVSLRIFYALSKNRPKTIRISTLWFAPVRFQLVFVLFWHAQGANHKVGMFKKEH